MPPQTLNEDAARLVSVFLGLVVAGILPAITLLVNTVSADGRSVKALVALGREVRELVKSLFGLLTWVGLSVVALLILFMPPPWDFPVGAGLRQGIGQAFALATLAGALDRTRAIPAAVFRCLDLRLNIATEEAVQKLREGAPNPGEASVHFATKAGFAAVRTVEEASR